MLAAQHDDDDVFIFEQYCKIAMKKELEYSDCLMQRGKPQKGVSWI